MKKFEAPQIEVQTFTVADVVTTSGEQFVCPVNTERD